MKHLFLKIILILSATLNSSCEEQNTNESTGNDTFSCYINGIKYIPSAGTGIGGGDIRPFSWAYTNFDDSTNPYLFTMGSGGDYTLSIRLINPNIGQNILNEELQLGLINTDFTQLKESVVTDIQEKKTSIAQLAQRSQVLAKGKTQATTPYENKHVFMVSPLNNTAIKTFSNTDVHFEIGQLGLNQSTQKIKSLHVVYKGKTTSLILNGKLVKPKFSQRFTTSGVKEMQFNAVFTNGKKLSHKAKFTVAIKTLAKKEILLLKLEPPNLLGAMMNLQIVMGIAMEKENTKCF